MERLKMMKENLMSCVQAQISGNLNNVDAKELGEAIDMIKDLEEAIYYGTITKAMEENGKENSQNHQQSMYYPPYRDMEREHGRMYYDEMYYGGPRYYDSNGRGASNEMRNSYSYSEKYPMEIRDYREGRSPIMRKSYMESKETHKDTKTKMHELEKYMQELTQDIVEMIEGATTEEKQILQQKIGVLATKVK